MIVGIQGKKKKQNFSIQKQQKPVLSLLISTNFCDRLSPHNIITQ